MTLVAYLKAARPMYRPDTLIVEEKGFRLEYRAWFDGDHIAILHEEGRISDDDWSRWRFYLSQGKLVACSTTVAYPPGKKYRHIETFGLFDPKGGLLYGTVHADGQALPARDRLMRSLHDMYEQTANSIEGDLLERRRLRSQKSAH